MVKHVEDNRTGIDNDRHSFSVDEYEGFGEVGHQHITDTYWAITLFKCTIEGFDYVVTLWGNREVSW